VRLKKINDLLSSNSDFGRRFNKIIRFKIEKNFLD